MSAFQDLAGADCSGSNAMFKLAEHATADRSLQRDVATGEPLRQDAGPLRFGQARDDRLVEAFRAEQAQAGPAGPSTFRPIFQRPPPPPMADGGWADEFQRMSLHPAGPDRFDDLEQHYRAHAAAAARAANWGAEFAAAPPVVAPLQPHEFAELEKYYQAPAQTAKVTELTEEQWASEFAGQQPVQGTTSSKGKERVWADEFLDDGGAQFDADAGFSGLDHDLEHAWSDAVRNMGAGGEDDESRRAQWLDPASFAFAEKRIDEMEYTFEPENPFLGTVDPLTEGRRLFDTGNLSDAALAFEAAVRQDEHNAYAWLQLGLCQAANEKEMAAIAALQRAVREDPSGAEASLALSISYTNEGAETQAYDCLEQWLRKTYPNLPPSPPVHKAERHQQLVDLFLSTVQGGTTIDPDVQVGLGVLFNISCEYDKAVDCFRTALQVRPQDYLLWNRLGATLANSGHSEDAVSAYHEALKLKPTYVRALYNLGVSCINIGCLKEAAEHLLAALAMHGGGNQRNVSVNLWETLQRTLIMMQRQDLLELCAKRDVDLFRPHFDF